VDRRCQIKAWIQEGVPVDQVGNGQRFEVLAPEVPCLMWVERKNKLVIGCGWRGIFIGE
jgi:hypothetical protein